MTNILYEIEQFIETSGMSASTFGRLSVSDGKLVGDLRGRDGKRVRRLWPDTEARIRKFMNEYPVEQSAA